MDPSLLIGMMGAALAAVLLYTFIGFIPGTDETSVLLPITLALVLTGVDAMIVVTFFIAAIVTLNLTNTMPTALVGLPGGVMSSAMIEHTLLIKSHGKSAEIIKKMATASMLGVLIAIPVSLGLAHILSPFAQVIEPYGAWLFVIGAVFLSLISRHKVLSLLSIVPLAMLFESLRHLYWGTGVVPEDTQITVSFFLGITIGPLIFKLFSLLNQNERLKQYQDAPKTISIPKASDNKEIVSPLQILSFDEMRHLSYGALIVNILFVLSPVGLTILVGETIGKRFTSPLKRSTMSVVSMSATVQATYLSGIIIPLLALGIPLSPVAIGPGAALFNAPPVYTPDYNIHHILSFTQLTVAIIVGAAIALVISYVLITKYARTITRVILSRVPHEAVLALFIAFIVLLAFIDAGFINIFGVLLIGLLTGGLHKMGVNYGVMFMSLYAAPLLIEILIGGVF